MLRRSRYAGIWSWLFLRYANGVMWFGVAMPQSLSRILVHTVFSTKHRQPCFRDERLRSELHHHIGGILNTLKCGPIVVGGVEDHVHILSQLARTCEPAVMVKEVKRVSCLWIKNRYEGLGDFAWQAGYGMFSIGHSQTPTVRDYIVNQQEHHRKRSFQEEFRTLLERYDVDFDERYVWD